MNLMHLLEAVQTVLVIDWPGKEVPETLARAGLRVVVRGGPGPEDFSAYEWNGSEVTVRPIGRPPERVDLVYSYRPLSELPGIIALAGELHARIVWTQSGLSAAGVKDPKGCWLPAEELQTAQSLVQAAGMTHVSEPYILECWPG